jgi:hypothetical protein
MARNGIGWRSVVLSKGITAPRNRALAAKLCTRVSSASAASLSSKRTIRAGSGDHENKGQFLTPSAYRLPT